MEKIRNLSIRKSFFLYMGICLLCCFLLSTMVIQNATHTQNQIWLKYADVDRYLSAQNEGGTDYDATPTRPNSMVMSSIDHSISELCDFLQTYSSLFISVIGSSIAIALFYKNKLKVPLEELRMASKRIASNDLNFQITYKNKDEMGELCFDFEKMREQLMENNQKLWENLEEEKVLRAAIAHDIRSPLTVLKGYHEMLLDDVLDGTISVKEEEKMLLESMLLESMKQIVRMDRFIETMRKMNSLNGRIPIAKEISLVELKNDIQAEIDILVNNAEKKAILDGKETDAIFVGDKELILEVAENLISNALRYAKEQIKITVCLNEQNLHIYVLDDGSGFTEEADTVTRAFFRKNAKDSLEHAGLGMYISRMYCEQHNGKLVIENHKDGGAGVMASFGRLV